MDNLKSVISLIFKSKASLESYLSDVQIDSDSSNALQTELILLRHAYARLDSLGCVFSLFADQQVKVDVNENSNANLQLKDDEMVQMNKALRESEDRTEKKIKQAIKRFKRVAISNDQTKVIKCLKRKLNETKVDFEKLKVQNNALIEEKDKIDLQMVEMKQENEEFRKEKNQLCDLVNEMDVAYHDQQYCIPVPLRYHITRLIDMVRLSKSPSNDSQSTSSGSLEVFESSSSY